MTNEQLRMQMLSGIITEGQYKAKLEENKKSTKKSLKENFVGMGAINNPFIEREKTGYETAFEHFLGARYELKEEIDPKFEDVGKEDETIYKYGVGDIYKEEKDGLIITVRKHQDGEWAVAVYFTDGDHLFTHGNFATKEEAINYGRQYIEDSKY